jgi:putative acetyltransferase
MNINVKVVRSTDPDLLQLISRLDNELYERYPAEEVYAINMDDPKVNDIVFVVAYKDNIPVGCGAIRPLDNQCTELKRFFVDRSYRRMGIAAILLKYLEGEAKELGFKQIRLETGTEQPEAINFYEKHGYYAIKKFGEYVDGEMSLCYEKNLI